MICVKESGASCERRSTFIQEKNKEKEIKSSVLVRKDNVA